MESKIEPLVDEHPEWILCMDHMPPSGQKVQMRTLHGNLFDGPWHPEYGVVAWRAMPKFTAEQRQRLDAAIAAGLDPTKFKGGKGNE